MANDTDLIRVDVLKFRFREPLTQVQFYYTYRDPTSFGAAITRTKHRYTLDGMEAVRLDFVHYDKGKSGCAYYLATNTTGWLIRSENTPGRQNDELLRPLSYRIAASFHRITHSEEGRLGVRRGS